MTCVLYHMVHVTHYTCTLCRNSTRLLYRGLNLFMIHVSDVFASVDWVVLAPRPLIEKILKTKILFKISQILLDTRF